MIDHGVYGEVVYKQDQKPDTPLYDVKITLMSFGQPLFYDARSNKDGLYEIEVAPGDYQICTEFAAIGCRTVNVTTVFRIDAVVWEGASYWEDTNFGECF